MNPDTEAEAQVRGLLGLAVDGLAEPSGLGVHTLRSRARKVRRHRRAAAVGGVACAVAAAVAIPLAVQGGTAGHRTVQPAASSPAATAAPEPMIDVLRSLLPADIGQVDPALDKALGPRLLKQEQAGLVLQQQGKTFDGAYSLRRGGRTGVLVIEVTTDQDGEYSVTPCGQPPGQAAPPSCSNRTLPDGAKLSSWSSGEEREDPTAGSPMYGGAVFAKILYPDGRVVQISASRGADGPDGYGPRLAEVPLTLPQVAALVQLPVWFTLRSH